MIAVYHVRGWIENQLGRFAQWVADRWLARINEGP